MASKTTKKEKKVEPPREQICIHCDRVVVELDNKGLCPKCRNMAFTISTER